MARRIKPELLGLVALAYVPFLASAPGQVSADSKQYLYLDPGRFLARAVDLWDPHFGAGTVPHQHLGYLFPAGPWFWLADAAHLPDWVAQRLWLGSISLAAALGARWLLQTLGLGRAGSLVGALAYMLTPYQLAFTARLSVLLLPWAALPWLVGLAMRVTRSRRWRDAALFALVLVAAGGVNASSLLLVGVAPLLWVILEMVRARAPDRGSTGRGIARAAVLSIGVSVWWVVGLRIQGAYGLPVLQLTERVPTVAEWSAPGDLIRGLGNWFFYGRDRIGYSIDQARAYLDDDRVVALSYAVPLLGLAAAFILRWAHRLYFAGLVVIGLVVGSGAWPLDDQSPYARLWENLASTTSAGLALRNTPRVAPIIILGLAALVAAGVSAIRSRGPRRAATAVVSLLALGGLLPVWQHGFLTEGMLRPEELPEHWHSAAAALEADGGATRVLALPGSAFAAYDWGTTVEPVAPGLMDRPFLAQEVLPYGTAGTANLLSAFDRRIQMGIAETASIVPMARLFGVGTVLLRGDLDRSGRFDNPDLTALGDRLAEAVSDGVLSPPAHFGPLALFAVPDPTELVRLAPVESPVVIAGDGDGLVDAAAAGLIDGSSLVLESAALDRAALEDAVENGAHLILTDTNRRRIQTWFYALRDTRGPTEMAGETAPDPTGYDFRLEVFPGTDDRSRTVVEQVGGVVRANAGGGPERPEDRAALVMDGDPETSWRVGGPDPRGATVAIELAEEVATSQIALVQPPEAASGRSLARVSIRFDDDPAVSVDLGPASLEATGQAVPVPGGRLRRVELEILDTQPPSGPGGPGEPVGLAEVIIGASRVDEVVRLPVDLLERAGVDSRDLGLDIVLTRLRIDIADAGRRDEESHLDRFFDLPTDRQLSLVAETRPVAGPGSVPAGACRSDVVLVDGEPVPIRAIDAPGHTSFEGCAPLDLSAGRHRVTTMPGRVSGLDVDRLVLSSAPGGEMGSLEVRGTPRSAEVARLTEVEAGDTTIRAQVEGPEGPFWFVLGQSFSDGWELSVPGAAVSDPVMVDGYAQGWIVTPDEPGAELVLSARWKPQRLVWPALLASALVALICIGIVWRTRDAAPGFDGLSARVAPLTVARDVPIGDAALAVAGMVPIGFLISPPAVVLVAAVTALGAAATRYGPLLTAIVAPGAVVVARLMHRPSLAWLAVLLLLVEVGLALVRRLRDRGSR